LQILKWEMIQKNLSTVINQIRSQSSNIAIMLFSIDHTINKFVCLANVSDIQIKEHNLKANEWIQTNCRIKWTWWW